MGALVSVSSILLAEDEIETAYDEMERQASRQRDDEAVGPNFRPRYLELKGIITARWSIVPCSRAPGPGLRRPGWSLEG
jgi:hypothetical protein